MKLDLRALVVVAALLATVTAASFGIGPAASDTVPDAEVLDTTRTATGAGDVPSDAPRTPTVAVPQATPTPSATNVSPAAPAPTVAAVATATPTPTPVPQRGCLGDPTAYDARIAELELAVASALSEYDGTFGFALYDIECDALVTVNGDHVQYAASTGKLPFVIAALRAVEEGRLDFEEVRGDLELVLRQSLDDNANNIVSVVEPEEVWEVLHIAGASEETTFQDSWSNLFSTAPDLSRIWAAVLRGELLNPQWTEYLLGLASEAEVPPLYETFSSDVEMPGLQFGQKAGYAVSFGPPYYFVGSGFLRPVDGSAGGFAATLLTVTNADPADSRRREVFPVVVDFVLEALAEVTPPGAR